MAHLEAALPPGGIFVDCGAHVGIYTLVARSRVGRHGTVVAIEPDPRSRAQLLENLELKPDVLIYNDANSRAAGKDPQLERAVEVLLEQLK